MEGLWILVHVLDCVLKPFFMDAMILGEPSTCSETGSVFKHGNQTEGETDLCIRCCSGM